MKLKKVLEGLPLKIPSRLAGTGISCVTDDSRRVKKGCLFIAVTGFKHDGHKFVNRALAAGAAAVIVDAKKRLPRRGKNIIEAADTREALLQAAGNFYRSPSKKLTVVGITGTNGKTTTSLLIKSIFKASRIPCGLIGTIEYRTGARGMPAARTTPGTLELNRLLNRMLRNGLKAAVMEVSSHALDQKRAGNIYFDTAVFTNLTREHLDYHGTAERYLASKARIFDNLKKGGAAVLNADEKFSALCAKKIKNHRIIRYGFNKSADISAKILKAGADGSSFTLKILNKPQIAVRTSLVGLHNISNILAAAAVATAQGLSAGAIKKGIENVKRVPGRLEPVKGSRTFRVFVDYAHTHNALENVLKFLKRVNHGKIITVFGCGGDRDRGKRPLMGEAAQKFSDFVILTDDNPRNENPAGITREILKGMREKKRNYCVMHDRYEAIKMAVEKTGKGDILLIAGKGHEKTQIIGSRKIPFDDKKAAEDILMRRRRRGAESGTIKGLTEKACLISTDSRTIKKGEIFLAIKGRRFNGHDFLEKAFDKGAFSAVVSEGGESAPQGKIIKVKNTVKTLGDIARARRRKFNIPVVAVSGSTGKTTAKEMIAHVLSAKYNVLKSENSNNSFVGLPLTLIKLNKRHRVCVLEMGMNHAGEIDALCKIAKPDIGVITNIGPAHIGFLGSIRNICGAKKELLNNLPARGTAILNRDDAYLKGLRGFGCQRAYFGIDEKCDFRAVNPARGKNGWRFLVGKEVFELGLPGRHNIYNALAAIAVGRQFKISLKLISRRIKSFRQKCPMRLELKKVRGIKIMDDSYNSNPSSMAAAIEALADCRTAGKKIIVSGDMLELGPRAKAMHEGLGRAIAKSPAEVLITLGALSKFTNRTAAQKGVKVLFHAATRGEAAGFLKKTAKPGDVVLVKGSREMRMEKIIEEFKENYGS